SLLLHLSAVSSVIFLVLFFFLLLIPPPPSSTLFPYTTLFRSTCLAVSSFSGSISMAYTFLAPKIFAHCTASSPIFPHPITATSADRKSTRLNSSHVSISYAVFCLKKKKKKENITHNTIHHSI